MKDEPCGLCNPKTGMCSVWFIMPSFWWNCQNKRNRGECPKKLGLV